MGEHELEGLALLKVVLLHLPGTVVLKPGSIRLLIFTVTVINGHGAVWILVVGSVTAVVFFFFFDVRVISEVVLLYVIVLKFVSGSVKFSRE
jgi:hypothetical protein